MEITGQRMLIDGELVAASDGREYDNINPATEEVIGTAPSAGAADVERAIGAARRAFDGTDWSTNVELRQQSLRAMQEYLRKDVERIRAAHTAEVGMPVSIAQMIGVDGPIENLSYYTDMIGSYEWERHLPTKTIMGGPSLRTVRKEAAGVVSAITPWNYPFQLNLTKIGTALAAGCTVVLKPAPDTPWSGTLLAEAAAHAGIPAGVFNVITTPDNSVAEIMTTHKDVDHVTFTGSTNTGRLVMRNASETLKRVSLELGGKSASIVLDAESLQSRSASPSAARACTPVRVVRCSPACSCRTRSWTPQRRSLKPPCRS